MNFPFTTVLEAEGEPARLQLHRSYITLHYIALHCVTFIWQALLSKAMYSKCVPKVIGTTTKRRFQ
uniref:Uncharacterized protein n=1 Tax=Anguilla anguilla TaxID=7936 RepID=A0A0E9S7E5_ANGAN